MVVLSVKTIEKIRDDKSFDPFCAKVITLVTKFNVSDPSLPRKRKVLGDMRKEVLRLNLVKDHYRRYYDEALDMVIILLGSNKGLINLVIKYANIYKNFC